MIIRVINPLSFLKTTDLSSNHSHQFYASITSINSA